MPMTAMVLAPARHHAGHGPPVQHRELVADDLARGVLKQLHLLPKPGEALHNDDVGQCILCHADEFVLIVLGLGLALLGAADDDEDHHAEHQHEQDQCDGEPPIEEDSQWQHDNEGGECGLSLTKEGEPDVEHRPGPGVHDFHQPAGLRLTMEGWRQAEDVGIKPRHRLQPVAMGEAVGIEGDKDVGPDRDRSDAAPQCEKREEAFWIWACHRVDDPAEQQRVEEQQACQHEVGRREQPAERAVWSQDMHDAQVVAEEFHAGRLAGNGVEHPARFDEFILGRHSEDLA